MNSDRGFRQQNVFPALPPPLFSLSAEATDFHAPRAGRSRAGRFAKSLHGPFQYLALMILAGFVVLLCLVRFKDQPIEGMGERSIAALHVTDMAGKPVRLDDGSGAVTLVSLWFAECLPCIKEVPALNEIAADFRHEKVRFVAVTFDSPDVAREFAARHGLELPLAFAGLGHLTEVAGRRRRADVSAHPDLRARRQTDAGLSQHVPIDARRRAAGGTRPPARRRLKALSAPGGV